MEPNPPPPYSPMKLAEESRKPSGPDATHNDRLIIALDFGTTYSGIAYAFSNDPEKIYNITSWPGGDDRIVPKTPTVIKYESGSDSKFQWGYQLDGVLEDKVTGLKLLFDPGQPRPYYIPTNVEAEIAKLPKSVMEVASDYMRAIYQHSLAHIQGEFLDQEYLNKFEKHFVLTVPAVWSDKSKDMTLKAARNAGILTVDMITEPEAGALYTLQQSKKKGLQAGDAVVVCDAGGGTVDLVAYEIESMNPFEVKALTKPSGGIHGSFMINKLFEKEIQETVGDEAWIGLKKTNGYLSALREFDTVHKIGFRGKGDPDKFVSFPMANLPDNPVRGLVKNAMKLSGETLYKIFDPVVREANKLVSDQVTEVKMQRLQAGLKSGIDVKAIFLVGGFGASKYMKELVEKSNPGVLVIQPQDAWAAIAKGAVMCKLPNVPERPKVISTVAKVHYGTSCFDLWDSFRDRGRPRVTDQWDGHQKCEIMRWFIYKEEDLARDKKIKFPFFRTFDSHDPSGPALMIEDQLFVSAANLAPTHPDDGQDVTVHCLLTTDLNQVPKEHFVKRQRLWDRVPFCELGYNLQVENMMGEVMKFSLEINGKEYSAVEVQY